MPMQNLHITPIRSADELPACAAILVAAYNAEPWNDEWTPDKALEKLQCFYQSPKFYGWMAKDGDQLLGCLVGNVEPYYSGDYFYLKEMFVMPTRQHQGTGKALLATLKAHLADIGIETIILFTSQDHFPWGFYLQSGFAEMTGMRMMACGPTE
jgi:aminoglycoside 6'-N-acetyltransferase I